MSKQWEGAEWENGAALTAGSGNQGAAAGRGAEASFLLCTNEPEKEEENQVHGNRGHRSKECVNYLGRLVQM